MACFRWAGLAGVWAALVVVQGLAWLFFEHHGVAVTGDSPNFLVFAQGLSRGHLHLHATYLQDSAHHRLYQPAGLASQPPVVDQLNLGPHGLISGHSPGLPALLAPFFAVFGATSAAGFFGLFAWQAAGFTYLHHRSADLVGLSGRARLVSALLLAGPATVLASTQVLYDFDTGVVLAIVLIELAHLERRRLQGVRPLIVIGAGAAYLPWFHVKNLPAAVVALAALTLVLGRQGRWRAAATVGVPTVVSWLLLLAYDQYWYGHLLGVPGARLSVSVAGLTTTLGLLLDRDQGLLVQVPCAAVGLLGIWHARRVVPVTGAATILAALSLLAVNGPYVDGNYGGLCIAGRFELPLVAPLLAWCPVVLRRLQAHPARLAGLAVAVAVLWAAEAAPILISHHVYFNAFAGGRPWDPSTYPGWWGPLDPLLPEFISLHHLVGRPGYGAVFELGVLAAGAAVIHRLTIKRPVSSGTGSRLLAAGLVAVVVGVVGASRTAAALPSAPLRYAGGDFGGPLVGGPTAVTGPVLPLAQAGRGRFRLTVDYRLTGAGPAGVTLSCAPKTSGPGRSEHAASLGATGRGAVSIRCPAGTIRVAFGTAPDSQLAVHSASLTKTGN